MKIALAVRRGISRHARGYLSASATAGRRARCAAVLIRVLACCALAQGRGRTRHTRTTTASSARRRRRRRTTTLHRTSYTRQFCRATPRRQDWPLHSPPPLQQPSARTASRRRPRGSRGASTASCSHLPPLASPWVPGTSIRARRRWPCRRSCSHSTAPTRGSPPPASRCS